MTYNIKDKVRFSSFIMKYLKNKEFIQWNNINSINSALLRYLEPFFKFFIKSEKKRKNSQFGSFGLKIVLLTDKLYYKVI